MYQVSDTVLNALEYVIFLNLFEKFIAIFVL